LKKDFLAEYRLAELLSIPWIMYGTKSVPCIEMYFLPTYQERKYIFILLPQKGRRVAMWSDGWLSREMSG